MVTYEVTAVVEPHLAEAYERYMREDHIPALLNTGCFVGASIARSASGRYLVRYEARDQADLDRYLAGHASRLRDEFASHLPAGVTLGREVWMGLQSWDAPD